MHCRLYWHLLGSHVSSLGLGHPWGFSLDWWRSCKHRTTWRIGILPKLSLGASVIFSGNVVAWKYHKGCFSEPGVPLVFSSTSCSENTLADLQPAPHPAAFLLWSPLGDHVITHALIKCLEILGMLRYLNTKIIKIDILSLRKQAFFFVRDCCEKELLSLISKRRLNRRYKYLVEPLQKWLLRVQSRHDGWWRKRAEAFSHHKEVHKIFDYQLLEQFYYNSTVLPSEASRLQILLTKMGDGQSHFKQITICKNKCAYDKFCLLVFLRTNAAIM